MVSGSAFAGNIKKCPSRADHLPEFSYNNLEQFSGKNYTLYYVNGNIKIGTRGADLNTIRRVYKVKKGELIGDTYTIPSIDIEFNSGFPNYIYMVVHDQAEYCLQNIGGKQVNYVNPNDRVNCNRSNTVKVANLKPIKFKCK